MRIAAPYLVGFEDVGNDGDSRSKEGDETERLDSLEVSESSAPDPETKDKS